MKKIKDPQNVNTGPKVIVRERNLNCDRCVIPGTDFGTIGPVSIEF